MADAPESARRLEELERRLSAVEARLEGIHPTVEQHDDRLDEHDTIIGQLGVRLADVRLHLERMVSEQHRLADAITVQGRAIETQTASLELILRNTASIAASLGVSK